MTNENPINDNEIDFDPDDPAFEKGVMITVFDERGARSSSPPEINIASACWKFVEVVKICADIYDDYIKVKAWIAGVKVGEAKLSIQKPKVKFKSRVDDVAKAEVVIQADFNRNKLFAKGKGCLRELNIPPSWSCRTFKTTLLSW